MFSVVGFLCSVGPVESALIGHTGPGTHAIRAFSPTKVTVPFGLLRPASRPVSVSTGNRQSITETCSHTATLCRYSAVPAHPPRETFNCSQSPQGRTPRDRCAFVKNAPPSPFACHLACPSLRFLVPLCLLAFSLPRFLASLLPCFLASLLPCFLASLLPRFLLRRLLLRGLVRLVLCLVL
jgi:hypothetical protein